MELTILASWEGTERLIKSDEWVLENAPFLLPNGSEDETNKGDGRDHHETEAKGSG